MKFLIDFWRQKAPSPGKEMPHYYRRALLAGETVLAGYFLLCFLFFPLAEQRWEWIPAVLCLASVFAIFRLRSLNIITNSIVLSVLVLFWSGWGVYRYGWSYGVQHFLVLLLLFLFFNICISPKLKVLLCAVLLAFRMGLFAYSQAHEAVVSLSPSAGILFQTLNSSVFFLLVAFICVIFSSSIQDTERKLRLDNQLLNREAGTDPLTKLPNRREMVSIIETFQKESPETPFCVAIADIDFFKNVNDTYGHACGDDTLVRLTELFRRESKGNYWASRWGGEEFCFFIPGKNLDEAGMLMTDLSLAVEKMALDFEGHPFSITITVGVEETDFKSPLDALLKSADEKLYMGKNAGRNRVVV